MRGIAFGAFDPFHYGHWWLLWSARQRCDILSVAVSTADYIERHKQRPEAVAFELRKQVIASLDFVDVVLEQSTTKQDVLLEHPHDVIFVGDDWTPETFTGHGLLPVIYLPRMLPYSSTLLRGLHDE